MSTNELKEIKNKQGVFDRQLEMCATFVHFNNNINNSNRVFDYSIDNNFIEMFVFYDRHCDWSPENGKKQIIDLVKHYKLHLLGYELQKIHFVLNIKANSKYKHTCKYIVPLNLLKYNCNVFYFCPDYLTYEKIKKSETFKLF